MHALDQLKHESLRAREDPQFQAELAYDLKHYVGRPSPEYFAKRLTEKCGGAQIWLKPYFVNRRSPVASGMWVLRANYAITSTLRACTISS